MIRKQGFTKGKVVTCETDDRCMLVACIGTLLTVTRVADCGFITELDDSSETWIACQLS
jgi:hypothetical protein